MASELEIITAASEMADEAGKVIQLESARRACGFDVDQEALDDAIMVLTAALKMLTGEMPEA